MPFKKGQSGNPKGRRKGSIGKKVAFKNLLEEVFDENRDKAKQMLSEMFKNQFEFRKLCEFKMQFEIKELPLQVEGIEQGPVNITVEVAQKQNETQTPPLPGNRISQYIEI